MRKKNRIERRSFAKIPTVVEMPYLLDLQISSFDDFLQLAVSPGKRLNQGLQAVFKSIFPITDVHNKMMLDFVDYSVGVPKSSATLQRMAPSSLNVPVVVVTDPESSSREKLTW